VKGLSDAILEVLPYVYVLAGLYALVARDATAGTTAGLLLLAVSVSLFKLRFDRRCKGRTLSETAARRGAR
jgi:hypothetical protein